MFMKCRVSIAILAVALWMIVSAERVPAQCDGGGGGGVVPAGGTAASFARLSSGRSALAATYAARAYPRRYASSPVLAMGPQYFQPQQQVLANHQQKMRQQAQQRYHKSQKSLTVRRERADAIRLARADRAIARLQAKQKSNQWRDSTGSRSIYVSKRSDKISSLGFSVQ